MQWLNDVGTEKFELEVWQCQCGFIIGFDFSYLEEVGEIKMNCPVCHRYMKTYNRNVRQNRKAN